MRARMLGAHVRVEQKGIGEPHVFLLICASWAEPKTAGLVAQNIYKLGIEKH